MNQLPELFDNNRGWAAGMVARHPRFFNELSAQQAPRYLWIGCSDSRVPANEIVGLAPGELFVHRDVAHLYREQLLALPTDLARRDRLCELNVMIQARRVCRTTIVQQAWERGRPLTVHAWVYSLSDGLLRDLGFCVSDLASAEAEFSHVAGLGTIGSAESAG